MSKTQPEVAVIIGVGASRGLGAALARRFGREGLHTVLAGRSPDALALIQKEVEDAGGAATICQTDTILPEQVEHLFKTASGLGRISAVLYNAGNNAIVPFQDITPKFFEDFWRVICLGGFLAGQAALPHMLPHAKGSILFTGASGSLRGKTNFAAFASAKAGLRNMAQSMAREFGPQGIHIGHVIIDGVIEGDKVRNLFGDYVDSLGEDGALNPDAIAEAFWTLHSQQRSAWTFELDVRPFKENW